MSCELLLRFVIGAVAVSGPGHIGSKSHRHLELIRLLFLSQQSQQGRLSVGCCRERFCYVYV
eukprot:1583444-Prorocentrum_lima.AAC.1